MAKKSGFVVSHLGSVESLIDLEVLKSSFDLVLGPSRVPGLERYIELQIWCGYDCVRFIVLCRIFR